MTRILVQRGSNSNQSRSSSSSSASAQQQQLLATQAAPVKEEHEEEVQDSDDYQLEPCGNSEEEKLAKKDEHFVESNQFVVSNDDVEKVGDDDIVDPGIVIKDLGGLTINTDETTEMPGVGTSQIIGSSSHPPPPPVPPPKPFASNMSPKRTVSGGLNSTRIGTSRRPTAWPLVSGRTSPSDSRPSSPRSYGEAEGYNSADEQNPCFGSTCNDAERERQFELDLRRTKGLDVRRMLEDGNCLFRAVADQVYGDAEAYDLTRQMCIDYMERERDHFSQFITEGFTSYCKRKRRDKVYGNNVEIQALSEMYNRPIHIYSYSTEPINIFHGSYNTDTPPIRLSYHHGNHYNSLVDPRRLTIGAGLGFSSLQGADIDKDRVKAAIRAQQDQQIDNALIAEGRFYSDLELTEKEIERMVMEASRAEYLNQPLGFRESSSTSGAEPSSSGANIGSSRSAAPKTGETGREREMVLSSNMQMLLTMGFSYLQVIEAYSIFGDDMDSMVCYLLETGSSSRRSKGKATE
ncbi:ubiquitinyl hydrolase 1 [Ranunculus cassubicifolius]